MYLFADSAIKGSEEYMVQVVLQVISATGKISTTSVIHLDEGSQTRKSILVTTANRHLASFNIVSLLW